MKSIVRLILTLLIISCTLFFQLNAQVAINEDNSAADASAMLDVKSTDKGMLIPRMTTAQRTAIAGGSPATGLFVYDTDTNAFWYYDGTTWVNLSGTTAVTPTIMSDADNDTQIQVEESTDEDHIRFDVAGTEAMTINNTGIVDIHTNAVIGNMGLGIESTDQETSNAAGLGYTTTPWIYTNAIEAQGERGTNSTLITLGTDGTYGGADQVHIVTDGASQLMVNSNGRVGINENAPDDRLHITDGGNGTRVRTENTGSGWAGLVAKNTVREMFIGIQGAFDPNPGEFHIYDNTVGARRMVIDAAGEVGIGRNNPSVKLDVNGSVNCTGGTCSSDLRWKKDIRPLERALDKVVQMRGVSYDWRIQEFPDRDFSEDRQIGLIAQEVERIYPELVKTDNEGFKAMDYMSLTAILLESIKELKQEKDVLTQEVNSLKKSNESLTSQMVNLMSDVTAIKAMLQTAVVDSAKTED